ncbi:MAG: hypothetical protein IJ689_04080 [Alphaproteobacteria bacterium]|nr:hypothetical protein [Alphaproteobacteria bacterium]
MRKFGFKLFSTNLQNNPALVDEAAEFVRNHKERMFIELMVIPDCGIESLNIFKHKFADLEVRIHAPHNIMGFDAGSRELEKSNIRILASSQRAADILQAKSIVVHAGCGHGARYLQETARQFKLFADSRIVVENLPAFASDETPLHGNTPDEIALIMAESGCGFCFDFSHAICAANYYGLDIKSQLKGFYNLKPTVYHMCDGMMGEMQDKHLHFGDGNYPLEDYLNGYTASNAYITMETGHGIPVSIKPWVKDYEYLLKSEK